MRRYTLAQIEALHCIVRFGTFQAAADHLNVTQPTISLRIRELESIVGYALVRRSGGKGELTAEGSVFYQYAERLIKTLTEMDRRLRTQDPLQGVLRLGASDTFAISCLPELLSKLENAHPHLRVELTIGDSHSLGELLNSRMLDIAFMTETPMDQHVRVHRLADCQLGWFGRAAHNNLTKTLTAADVATQRLMTLPVDRVLNSIMVRWFEASNHPVPSFSTCNSLAMLMQLISGGHTWSILPVSFASVNGPRALPPPLKVVPDLPILRLCSAYQTEGTVDTLAPVVCVARDIAARTHGFILPNEAPPKFQAV